MRAASSRDASSRLALRHAPSSQSLRNEQVATVSRTKRSSVELGGTPEQEKPTSGRANRLTGAYSTGDHVSSEMPPRPDGFYGVSKVAGEALCRLYADKFGLSTISLRIGSHEDRPASAREQRTWLSPADAIRAFVAAMTTTERTAVFYAVSANTDGWWDLRSGEAVGFFPQDDAVAWARDPIDPDLPQGGEYATPAYSTDRMLR